MTESGVNGPGEAPPREPPEPPPEAIESARHLTRGGVEALPTGELARQLAEGRPLRVKLGIDPTAPDIHLGHTVVLQKLHEFQDSGHQVVLIIGDYTARVGDPSGRSAARPVLSPEQIDENARSFQEQAFKVLDPERTEVRFNSEWLDMRSEELFDLLRRFTVARLLERDDFERRMAAEQSISLLELLYPVLQGYDSVAIRADVEVGGTDQTFNLLFGRVVQQGYGQPPQSILTTPILPGIAGGERMSKSAGNYVGVTEPPEEMFGKLMRISDELMVEYYRLLLGEEPDPERQAVAAKRSLARRIVARFHDEDAAARAEERFDRVHVRREAPDDVEVATIAAGEVHLPALLAEHFGLSRSEARRLIGQGGVRVNGELASADELDIDAQRLDGALVSVGRRRFKRFQLA